MAFYSSKKGISRGWKNSPDTWGVTWDTRSISAISTQPVTRDGRTVLNVTVSLGSGQISKTHWCQTQLGECCNKVHQLNISNGRNTNNLAMARTLIYCAIINLLHAIVIYCIHESPTWRAVLPSLWEGIVSIINLIWPLHHCVWVDLCIKVGRKRNEFLCL